MTDFLTPDERSELMSRIRSKDTTPERKIRALLSTMGFRYRLHGKDLPGCPDLVFRRSKRVIFVNGCFWHFHANCKGGKLPKSKLDYWIPKLEKNRARDRKSARLLRKAGWKILVIWDCQLANPDILKKRIFKFFEKYKISTQERKDASLSG